MIRLLLSCLMFFYFSIFPLNNRHVPFKEFDLKPREPMRKTPRTYHLNSSWSMTTVCIILPRMQIHVRLLRNWKLAPTIHMPASFLIWAVMPPWYLRKMRPMVTRIDMVIWQPFFAKLRRRKFKGCGSLSPKPISNNWLLDPPTRFGFQQRGMVWHGFIFVLTNDPSIITILHSRKNFSCLRSYSRF